MAAGSERPLNEVKFLTVAEVASVMRVSKMTVYRLVHSGHLPAIRVGRSFRVPEQAVHEYLRGFLRGGRDRLGESRGCDRDRIGRFPRITAPHSVTGRLGRRRSWAQTPRTE